MSAYWGCQTPRPYGSELVPFIGEDDWSQAVATAERLLCTTHADLVESAGGRAVRTVLKGLFDPMLPPDRGVRISPVAARPDGQGAVRWTGVDTILEPLDELGGEGAFELRAETICRSLRVEGDRVAGATIEHRPTGRHEEIRAKAVVVAADAFRTPQLLWASGIRPSALGRYLMDHPRAGAQVELDEELIAAATADVGSSVEFFVSQVPFSDPEHPFIGTVGGWTGDPALAATMFRGGMRIGLIEFLKTLVETKRPTGVAMMAWTGRTWPRRENRVVFSDTQADWCGMPAMAIEFELAEAEQEEALRGLGLLESAAASLGRYLPGGEPCQAPSGSSRHYMGTFRMGESDDGTSVCDARSRVWGFENLFVGGNGAIPTPTTCNPTLMSVALAAHASVALTTILDNG